MPVVYYMSGNNEFGPDDGPGLLDGLGSTDTGDIVVDKPTDPVLASGIICGTSADGKAIGYHDTPKDGYGEGSVTLGGLKVVQLRALGNTLRLRFDKDEAPQETVTVKLNDLVVTFTREDGQPRYNVEDAKASKLFVDGQPILVAEATKIEGDAPGTDVDTLTPGLDEVEEGGTIEPPSIDKETKPAKKKNTSKKK